MGGNIYDAEWLEFVIPSEKHSSNFLDAKNKYDGCEMYKSLNSIKSPSAISSNDENTCTPENFNSSNTEKCSDYIYDDTFFDETLATKGISINDGVF